LRQATDVKVVYALRSLCQQWLQDVRFSNEYFVKEDAVDLLEESVRHRNLQVLFNVASQHKGLEVL
jgi:hypothetical protein